ncbi:MAG: metallophosphoesterase [Candidatus Phocaeicola faecipullorum]|nr:metallophosphoesterase [Candidatus Phocaeicola faecipullorum]
MNSLRKNFITLFMALFVVTVSFAQTPESWKTLEKPLNFYLANDLGRNGYYDQKPIAELMGNMAENVDIECVIAAGDVHHFEGVRSVNDPLWMTNYELIYSHPELMIPWYAILGNHEYRGNTQAVIDYSAVSARWNVPDRYYTFAMENDGVTVRFVMVDTAPLLDKYREDTEKYPDACKQDMNKQLAWIDSVLTAAKEDWVLVVGHHPIYAETGKDDSERLDMQKRLDSILRKHKNVDMYLCGHIHNFQHIRKADSNIDYVVNTSGSLSRKVKPVDGTKFCSGETGFSLISVDKKELNLHMINKEGKVIYTVTRKK